MRATILPNELIDKIFPQPHHRVVPAAELDFGMYVVVPAGIAGGIVVDEGSANVEQRNHFVHVVIDDQRVYFPRRLEDVHPRAGHPVVLQVAP